MFSKQTFWNSKRSLIRYGRVFGEGRSEFLRNINSGKMKRFPCRRHIIVYYRFRKVNLGLHCSQMRPQVNCLCFRCSFDNELWSEFNFTAKAVRGSCHEDNIHLLLDCGFNWLSMVYVWFRPFAISSYNNSLHLNGSNDILNAWDTLSLFLVIRHSHHIKSQKLTFKDHPTIVTTL